MFTCKRTIDLLFYFTLFYEMSGFEDLLKCLTFTYLAWTNGCWNFSDLLNYFEKFIILTYWSCLKLHIFSHIHCSLHFLWKYVFILSISTIGSTRNNTISKFNGSLFFDPPNLSQWFQNLPWLLELIKNWQRCWH